MLPVASLLLSSTLWGLSWMPLHALRGLNIEGLRVVAIAFGIAGLLLLPALWRQRAHWRGQGRWLWSIAAVGGFSHVAYTLAVSYGDVVRVMVLFYLLPVWGVLGGRLFLGERLTALRIATMVLALGGAMLLIGAESAMTLKLDWTDWMAIACGLTFAANNLVFRAHQQLPVLSKVAAMQLGASAWALLLLAVMVPATAVATPLAYGGAALYGIWVLVATLGTQYGVTHLQAGRAAILIILELVASVISAVALGESVLGPREWIGVAMVLIAAFVEARSDTTLTAAHH